jgi:hypothetical protein
MIITYNHNSFIIQATGVACFSLAVALIHILEPQTEKERLSTLDLHIKIACLVSKKKHIFCIKKS